MSRWIVAEVGAARLDEQRVRLLVGGDLHVAGEERGGASRAAGRAAAARRARASARARRASASAAGRAARPARVAWPWARLERVCASSSAFAFFRNTTWMPPSPAVGHVELLDELADPLEALLVGDDDELVRALVGEDLRDRELSPAVAAAAAAAARRRGAGRARRDAADGLARPPGRRGCAGPLRLEDLVHLVGDVLRRGVADLDEADEVARAGRGRPRR